MTRQVGFLRMAVREMNHDPANRSFHTCTELEEASASLQSGYPAAMPKTRCRSRSTQLCSTLPGRPALHRQPASRSVSEN